MANHLKINNHPAGFDILEILLRKNILIKPQIDNIRQESKVSRVSIEEILERNKLVSKEQMLYVYGEYFGLPTVRLKDIYIPPELIKKIPEKIAEKYQLCVFGQEGDKLKIAIAKPSRLQKEKPGIIADIRKKQDLNVDLYLTTEDDLKSAFKYYHFKPLRVEVKKEEEPEPDFKSQPRPEDQLTASILDILIKQNLLSQKSARDIYEQAQKSGQTVEAVIRQEGNILEDDLAKAEGIFYNLPVINLKDVDIASETVKLLPENLARSYRLIIFEKISERIYKAATSIPDSPAIKEILDFLKKRNNFEIQLYVTTDKNIEFGLEKYQEVPLKRPKSVLPEVKAEEKVLLAPGELDIGSLLKTPIQTIDQLKEIVKSENVPRILAAVLNLAYNKHASDIHIEPREKFLFIRYRIDGVLKDIIQINNKLHPPIVARIKISSRLRIDEQRIPQDGRFDVHFQGGVVDIRVSTLPTSHGEKVVMRLLDKSKGIISLEELGLKGMGYEVLRKNIKKPFGMILATGPTGSGKTTTLYAILQSINSSEINIITLEDPIEYEIEGVNHCQARSDIGFSFAEGLRNILRQDPNVIMIGEIRDKDTAGMAIHASLTGHLVLSTLHTNDASGAVPRLIDMGIEPFLIASSVTCVIAQRLVRKLCPKCKQKISLPPQLLTDITDEIKKIPTQSGIKINFEELSFFRSKGCSECEGGYRGRIGIFEVLPITSDQQKLFIQKTSGSAIKQKATEEGMVTMRQDGFLKAAQGITSVDEVLRVTLTEKI